MDHSARSIKPRMLTPHPPRIIARPALREGHDMTCQALMVTMQMKPVIARVKLTKEDMKNGLQLS